VKLPAPDRYDYSIIDRRPDYTWPGGKRLAFHVDVSVEHFAFWSGIGEDISNPHAPQTQRNFGWRDYGQRVGLWRLAALLQELGLPVAWCVNELTYHYRPDLVARLPGPDGEIVAHGRTASERLPGMWEEDEAHLVRSAAETLARHHGTAPQGWLSPGLVETRLTPDLLAEAGYGYVLDWPADDQPFWMRTRSGRKLLSVPYPLELNDVTALLHRHHSAREFADMVVNQFDQMLVQSEQRPLVYALALSPYVCGQPFRLHALRKALAHCVRHAQADRVWFTTPGAIARHCASLPAGVVPGSLPGG